MANPLYEIKKHHEDTSQYIEELNKYIGSHFLINDSTVLEWKKFFEVKIPDEVTFPVLIELSREIAYKFQRASYFRDISMIGMAVTEQSRFNKYHETYNDVRVETQRETGKPLAAESCKVAAIMATKAIEGTLSEQKVIKDFWVKMCDSLTEIRKLVELMGYALSSDARVQRDFVVRGDGR